MESTHQSHYRNSCDTHYRSGGFFIFPLIFFAIFFSRGIIWPILVIFFIIFLASRPRTYRRRYYQPNSYYQGTSSDTTPRFVSKQYDINFCKNCGTKIEPDSLYCQECGFKLN